MVNYKVTVDGNEYPVSHLEYERDYSLEAQPFQVALPTLESINGGGTVEIYRDGDLVYRGKIYDIQKRRSGAKPQTVISGYDFKRKLAFLSAVNRTENTYPGTQIISNLPNTDLLQGTINDYGGSLSMSYGSADNSKFTRKRVLDGLSFATGWEIDVTPSGTLNFKSQAGTDLSASIRFNGGELLHRWNKPYTVNQAHKIKKVFVVGAGQGNNLTFGTAATGDYALGDMVITIKQKSFFDSDVCGTAATSVLADWQNDVKSCEIVVIDTFEGRAYDVFDTVKCEDDILNIDENLRVYHLKKRLDEKGEQTTLGLTNIQHLQTSGKRLLESGEALIDEVFKATDNYGRTHIPFPGFFTFYSPNQDEFTDTPGASTFIDVPNSEFEVDFSALDVNKARIRGQSKTTGGGAVVVYFRLYNITDSAVVGDYTATGHSSADYHWMYTSWSSSNVPSSGNKQLKWQMGNGGTGGEVSCKTLRAEFTKQ